MWFSQWGLSGWVFCPTQVHPLSLERWKCELWRAMAPSGKRQQAGGEGREDVHVESKHPWQPPKGYVSRLSWTSTFDAGLRGPLGLSPSPLGLGFPLSWSFC